MNQQDSSNRHYSIPKLDLDTKPSIAHEYVEEDGSTEPSSETTENKSSIASIAPQLERMIVRYRRSNAVRDQMYRCINGIFRVRATEETISYFLECYFYGHYMIPKDDREKETMKTMLQERNISYREEMKNGKIVLYPNWY